MTGNVDLRAIQEPLKEGYREHPDSGRITLTARGATGDTPIACSVDLGRAVYEAQAHAGVGGEGTGACSGDLLLGAPATCAQITCQMVAEAMGLEVNDIAVTVDGDLDLRGTLGTERGVPVGFESIECETRVKLAPGQIEERAQRFFEKAEQYCVVLSTLRQANDVRSSFVLE
jgi:uncharacterized OsmC-like protein